MQKHCYWFVKAFLLHRKSIEIATQKHCNYNTTHHLIDSNPRLFLFNSRKIRRESKAKTIKKRYLFDLTLFSFLLLIPSFYNKKAPSKQQKNLLLFYPNPSFFLLITTLFSLSNRHATNKKQNKRNTRAILFLHLFIENTNN